MGALKKFGADPPYKAPLADKAGFVSLTWLAWLNMLTKATTLRIASADYNPASIAGGATLLVNLTVPGARPGDFAVASFEPGNVGVTLLAQVTAADTVTVTFWNTTAGALDLAAGTLRVRVEVNA